jgi:hypothetical protein
VEGLPTVTDKASVPLFVNSKLLSELMAPFRKFTVEKERLAGLTFNWLNGTLAALSGRELCPKAESVSPAKITASIKRTPARHRRQSVLGIGDLVTDSDELKASWTG